MRTLRCCFAAALAAFILATGPAAAKGPPPLTGAFDPEQVLINLEKTLKNRDWKRYGEFLAEDFRIVIGHDTSQRDLARRDQILQLVIHDPITNLIQQLKLADTARS